MNRCELGIERVSVGVRGRVIGLHFAIDQRDRRMSEDCRDAVKNLVLPIEAVRKLFFSLSFCHPPSLSVRFIVV